MRLTNKARGSALLLALFLPGCASISDFFSDGPRGPGDVNDLNGSIERVYVDAELAKGTVRDAVGSLEGMMDGDLGEDPAATYTAFVELLDNSEKQAEQLRDSIDPMNANAQRVFKQWEKDLREFTSPTMLKRSEQRMEATRARYEKVREAAERAHQELVQVNKAMRDHALFLGHDLNADSIEAVKTDMREMAGDATKLESSLDRCMESAREYVAASALKANDLAARDAPATVAKSDGKPADAEQPKVDKVSNTQYVR
jgi:uncharacterized protein YaaN involved in tellurite resistance